jgi:hypothetical protein
MPELTVIMTVYNGEPYLAPALDSVLTQSIRNFDILVIDDGSTDGTPAILENYAGRDSRITVISQENRGVVAALNRAYALVQTPYIARLDADDISAPQRLERQLNFLGRNPDVALLGGAATIINHAGDILQSLDLYSRDIPTSSADIKSVLPERNVFINSAVVVRRDAVLDAGGYRRPFQTAEDYDMWLRIAERHEVANLPEVIAQYRVHPSQTTTTRLEQQILAGIGSRVSSNLRQLQKDDPFGSTEAVTRESLYRLGVSPGDIDLEVAKAAAHWAWVMRRAGYHQAAASMARMAWRHGRERALTRAAVGQFYFAAAREDVLAGHRTRGFLKAARALRWDPALLWRIKSRPSGE